MDKLKYHQATYDLLTKQRIDPQKAIENYDLYENQVVRSAYRDDLEGETLEEKLANRRREFLAWTRVDLYQRPIRISEKNIQVLDAIEQKYGIKLPEAVREWYSLDIMPEIMSATGWGYIPISKLRPLPEHNQWVDQSRTDLWFFLEYEYIEQGGENISFRIDEGDDPSVLAEHYSGFVELSSHFSQFIYIHFWDWYSRYIFEYGFDIIYSHGHGNIQTGARHTVPIEHLRANFQELAGGNRWRFYDEYSRIWPNDRSLWQREGERDSKPMLGGGEFRTNTLETLLTLMKRIWGDNAPVFEMDTYSANEESAELIDQMQKDLFRRVLAKSDDWITQRDLAFMLGARFENLSTTMWEQLKAMIDRGEVEAHPDNTDQRPQWLDNRYRIA